jgi:hypothetical protein
MKLGFEVKYSSNITISNRLYFNNMHIAKFGNLFNVNAVLSINQIAVALGINGVYLVLITVNIVISISI